MLTDEELRQIDEYASENALHTCKRLLAEVRELRLLLRDAVQDATPGNRLWREGVKAGLEAAARACLEKEKLYRGMKKFAHEWEHVADGLGAGVSVINDIDPATILP